MSLATNLWLVLLSGLLLVGCVTHERKPIRVSFVELLANPKKYDGLLVDVEGFYHSGLEESALYLSKEHAMHFSVSSSIELASVNKSTNEIAKVNDVFVDVVGEFRYVPKELQWKRELYDITFLAAVPYRELKPKGQIRER